MPNAKKVHEIVMDCLFREEEIVDGQPPEGFVKGEGVMGAMGFHPERLESHRADVEEQLRDLPNSFMASVSGGMTFLNMCLDRDGNQWGEHPTMNALCALGNALGFVDYPLPRDMWSMLPGGVPYVTVTLPLAASASECESEG